MSIPNRQLLFQKQLNTQTYNSLTPDSYQISENFKRELNKLNKLTSGLLSPIPPPKQKSSTKVMAHQNLRLGEKVDINELRQSSNSIQMKINPKIETNHNERQSLPITKLTTEAKTAFDQHFDNQKQFSRLHLNNDIDQRIQETREIRSLRKEIQKLKQENKILAESDSQKEIDALKRNNESLRTDFEMISKELREREIDNETKMKENQTLNSELELFKERNETVSTEFNGYKDKIQKVKVENDTLRTQNESIWSEAMRWISKEKDKAHNQSLKINELKQEVTRLSSFENELDYINKEKKRLEEMMIDVEAHEKVESLRRENKKLISVEDDLKCYKDQIEIIERENSRLNKLLEESLSDQENKKWLEKDNIRLKDKLEGLKTIENRFNQKRTECEKLRKESEISKNELKESNRMNKILKTQIESLKEDVSSLAKYCSKLKYSKIDEKRNNSDDKIARLSEKVIRNKTLKKDPHSHIKTKNLSKKNHNRRIK